MPDESLSNPDRSRAARFLSDLVPQTDNPEDAEFLRALLLLGGALFTLTLVAYACTTNWTGPFPRDKVTLVLGRDFLNLWMYGRAVAGCRSRPLLRSRDLQCRTRQAARPRLSRTELAEPADSSCRDGAVRLACLFPGPDRLVCGRLSRVLPRGAPRGFRRAYSRGGSGLAGRIALRALGPEFVAHDRGPACDLLLRSTGDLSLPAC